MGSLFSKPKMPTPQVIDTPTTNTADAQTALLDERKRRAGAVGSTGNIVSSLTNAVGDAQAGTRRSTLLGG